ncbi:MAG: TrkA family potassium uptake protein [Clostridia bacterium]|jgi:trk system potassium uptake protein TrkA|nr:TrkA family potassium uptake protein [Clostridia bacterium]MCI8979250.1 TrkA family potassium uptake protein [Clostridia bacterium]MCI9086177.1 TrkA family potassium uptake protein [Clostridia bacterium]NDO18987.1 TrkA family potassium uptake protein [Lachnospiraceae bacterium MD329]
MKTFAVIGLGRYGTAVVKKLFQMGYEVIAMDRNMEKVNAIADYSTKAVCGDAKDEEILRQSGIKNCSCVVVSMGNDITDSVLITLALKEMGVERVVCKASDEQHKKVLKKIGADDVIIPEYESGEKTAISLVSDKFIDIIGLSDEYGIENSHIPESWIGKSIAEISVRKRFGVNIVAIKNMLDDNYVNIMPPPEYIFNENDIVVLIGKITDINILNNKS